MQAEPGLDLGRQLGSPNNHQITDQIVVCSYVNFITALFYLTVLKQAVTDCYGTF